LDVLNSVVGSIGLLGVDCEVTAGAVELSRCVVIDVDPLDCGEDNIDGTV
jgi:hypothetical protein